MEFEPDFAPSIFFIESGKRFNINEITINKNGDMGFFSEGEAKILLSPVHAARLGYALIDAANEYKLMIDGEQV